MTVCPATAQRRAPLMSSLTQVTIYVWGHGQPKLATAIHGCQFTAQATQIASSRGWDTTPEDAWAFEITLVTSLRDALRQFGSQFHGDAAVAGWAMRTPPQSP